MSRRSRQKRHLFNPQRYYGKSLLPVNDLDVRLGYSLRTARAYRSGVLTRTGKLCIYKNNNGLLADIFVSMKIPADVL